MITAMEAKKLYETNLPINIKDELKYIFQQIKKSSISGKTSITLIRPINNEVYEQISSKLISLGYRLLKHNNGHHYKIEW